MGVSSTSAIHGGVAAWTEDDGRSHGVPDPNVPAAAMVASDPWKRSL